MISIIICSRSPHLLQAVSNSVTGTIGVPHEIIAVENSQGAYGICAAYNKGAAQSKYGLLCFMHEDILFQTKDWGSIVAGILSDRNIGLVGVTGSKYLAKSPAPWWGAGDKFYRGKVLEKYSDGSTELSLQNPEGETLSDVVAVDGLWFCTRREVWEQCPFDETTFPEFHGYDIDFSARIFQKYRVAVTFEILIEHSSRGSFNPSWLKTAIAFSKKWKAQLPMYTEPASRKEATRIEGKALQAFCSRLVSIGYDKPTTLRYILKSVAHAPLNRDNLWLLKKFISG